MGKTKFYTATKLLSYGKQISIAIGGRGIGKSYDWKKRAIKKFLKTGKQTMWVRRYKGEIKEATAKFLDDLIDNNEYPDLHFRIDKYVNVNDNVKTKEKGITTALYINDKPAIIFMPLSISSTFKGSAYPLIEYIVFDEFLITKSIYRYLSSEVVILLELIQTVFRRRKVRVIMLANAISFVNPYFMYYNIKPFKHGFTVLDSVAIEYINDEDFIAEMKETSFGKMVEGTEYGEYAIENKFLLDNDKFIGKRTKKAYNKVAIKYQGELFGFWFDLHEGMIFASQDVDPNLTNIYTLSNEDHDVNLFLVKNMRGTLIKSIVFAFQQGMLWFDNHKTKGVVMEMLSFFF